jgi:hypothetical protein
MLSARLSILAYKEAELTIVAIDFSTSSEDNDKRFATRDRRADNISFSRPKAVEETLTNWSTDITELLHLVETTTYLISKENMTYKV